jgi:hypothetical protein
MKIPTTSKAAMGTMMWKANIATAESSASAPVISRIDASSRERLLFARSVGELMGLFIMMVVVCWVG